MKQISIALNVILAVVLIFFSSMRQIKYSTTDDQQPKDCPPCTNCKEYPFSKISRKTAKDLADNYYHNMPDKDNSRCVWFSLDAMKAFICSIETANCNKCGNQLKLGVRIYFGTYPSESEMAVNPDLRDLPRDLITRDKILKTGYHNHNTVFLVPTYESSNNPNLNIDFDPNHIDIDKKCLPTPMSSIKLQDSISVLTPGRKFYIKSANSPQQEGKNHGDLIPPGNKSNASFLQ